MDAEDEVHIKAVLLIEAAFFGKEQGPLRAAPVGIVDRDLPGLRLLLCGGRLLFGATAGGDAAAINT